MAEELGFTSTEQGLDPSASGLCTVFRSPGVGRPLQSELEALSGYRPQFLPGTPHEDQNPTNYAHQIISDGRRRWHVVSRTCYSGSDYTGRNNHFAHHVLFGPEERPANGPAWLAGRDELLERRWNGKVEVLPAARSLPYDNGDGQARVCQAWADTVGDAGWAGRLAQMYLESPSLPCYLIYRAGQAETILPLIKEAMALLPPEQRWGVTFCTYYTSGGKSDCLWRGVLEGTPEAGQALRGSDRARVFDLRSANLGPAPASDWAEYARNGTPPAAAAAFAASTADGGGYATRGNGGHRAGTVVMPKRRAAAPVEEFLAPSVALQPAPVAAPAPAPAPPPPPPAPRSAASLSPTVIAAISIGACCLGIVVGALLVKGLRGDAAGRTAVSGGTLARTTPAVSAPAPTSDTTATDQGTRSPGQQAQQPGGSIPSDNRKAKEADATNGGQQNHEQPRQGSLDAEDGAKDADGRDATADGGGSSNVSGSGKNSSNGVDERSSTEELASPDNPSSASTNGDSTARGPASEGSLVYAGKGVERMNCLTADVCKPIFFLSDNIFRAGQEPRAVLLPAARGASEASSIRLASPTKEKNYWRIMDGEGEIATIEKSGELWDYQDQGTAVRAKSKWLAIEFDDKIVCLRARANSALADQKVEPGTKTVKYAFPLPNLETDGLPVPAAELIPISVLIGIDLSTSPRLDTNKTAHVNAERFLDVEFFGGGSQPVPFGAGNHRHSAVVKDGKCTITLPIRSGQNESFGKSKVREVTLAYKALPHYADAEEEGKEPLYLPFHTWTAD